MKPKASKVKDVRGRIQGYIASVGPVCGWQKETPAQAVASCDEQVHLALTRLDRGALIHSWRGHTYVIAPTVTGWAYWIDTMSRTHLQPTAGAEREDVENAALAHLAQHVWTEAEDDGVFLASLPPSVAAELKPWIRFQRRYTELRGEGLSDNDAHRLASLSGFSADALSHPSANPSRPEPAEGAAT